MTESEKREADQKAAMEAEDALPEGSLARARQAPMVDWYWEKVHEGLRRGRKTDVEVRVYRCLPWTFGNLFWVRQPDTEGFVIYSREELTLLQKPIPENAYGYL